MSDTTWPEVAETLILAAFVVFVLWLLLRE